MKMLEVTILNHFNKISHSSPTLSAKPTFMRAIQKCPIYLGMHTYNTFKSVLSPKTNTLLFMQQLRLCYLQGVARLYLYISKCKSSFFIADRVQHMGAIVQ